MLSIWLDSYDVCDCEVFQNSGKTDENTLNDNYLMEEDVYSPIIFYKKH